MVLPLIRVFACFLLISIFAGLSSCIPTPQKESSIHATLRPEIRELGARNWVVIAEAAFPIQSRKGLEVLQLDADIPEIVEAVEQVIEETHHLKPRIYQTTEIGNVDYDYAPGVKNYRKELTTALYGRETFKLEHDILLDMMNNTSKTYRVILIKSRTALTYSTVFMEMGSGYWGVDSESALRDAMEKVEAE